MNLSTPMDGHCLLLMEPQAGLKTFSDYPNVEQCLDSLLAIYEETPDHSSDYTLDIIWKWLDNFDQITLYVFDEELARYKKVKHSELKELFIRAIQRSEQKQENGVSAPQKIEPGQQRGQANNQPQPYRSESRVSRFQDKEDDDDEEDWD